MNQALKIKIVDLEVSVCYLPSVGQKRGLRGLVPQVASAFKGDYLCISCAVTGNYARSLKLYVNVYGSLK